MTKLVTKKGTTTAAFYILHRASWHGPQVPDFKRREYKTFKALEALDFIAPRHTGPRGGTQYHITQVGQFALDAAREYINAQPKG